MSRHGTKRTTPLYLFHCYWVFAAVSASGAEPLSIEEVTPHATTGPFGRAACFVNESHLLVVGDSSPGIVRLLDASTGDVVQRLGTLKRGIQSICSSGDGSRVAAGSFGGEIEVWSIPDGKSVGKFDYGPLKESADLWIALDVAGKRLLSASGTDGKVREYLVERGSSSYVFDFAKREGTRSNHANDLFWVIPDKRIALRGLQYTFSFPFNERGDTYRLGFDKKVPDVVARGPGTSILFIAFKDWMLRDAETGMLIKSWTDGPRLASLGRVDKHAADYNAKRDVWAMGASQSELTTTGGTTGLSVTGLLVLVDGKTGDALRVIKVGKRIVQCVKISSDGKYVCAANDKDELCIWKLDELLKPAADAQP